MAAPTEDSPKLARMAATCEPLTFGNPGLGDDWLSV